MSFAFEKLLVYQRAVDLADQMASAKAGALSIYRGVQASDNNLLSLNC